MKRQSLLIILATLGVILALNLYFRFFPVNFPQLLSLAETRVKQGVYQKAIESVGKRYPGFSPFAQDSLINALVAEEYKLNAAQIQEQIKQEYLKLKDPLQDAAGQTYLMELDCWHWTRYTDNVVRYGHPGDRVIRGQQIDDLMLAPLGMPMAWNNFLFFFSAWLYKIFAIFKPVSIYTFTFYLPLFFAAVFLTALYALCYRHIGNLAAIISCLFVGLSPAFLPRSCAGWFDMDILNLFFPLMIVWTYLLAHQVNSFKPRIFWLSCSAFFLGLFAFTWVNWWFVLGIIAIYEFFLFMHLILGYLQYREHNLNALKERLASLFLFLIFSAFWIVLFCGGQPLKSLFLQVRGAINLNRSFTDSIWPNVYFTVAELRRADLEQFAIFLGGRLLFLASCVSMLIIFLRSRIRREGGFKGEFITLLIIWFFCMYFACYRGIRFIVFLLIPLGISLGWVINDAFEFVQDKKKRVLIFIVVLILLFSFMDKALVSARNTYPLINDVWYNLLISLKENTFSRAIINSWWDFGDWFKTIAARPVIFDGQSQDQPQAYWMAKVLLTNDEGHALRILRMLNNSGNQAFLTIDKHLHDPLASALLLEKILAEPALAKEILTKSLPPQAVEEIMRLIFAKPGEAYFIVDPSMPEKMFAISFLGNWDFLKAYLAQNVRKNKQKEILDKLAKLGVDAKTALAFYQEASLIPDQNLEAWFSQRKRFYGFLSRGQEYNDIVFFENGLVYNPAKQSIFMLPAPGTAGNRIPKSLFIFKEGKLKEGKLEEFVYPDSNLNFSVLVLKTKEGYRAIGLDRQLGNSLFVRLYFLEGSGLKHFKPFLKSKEGEEYIRVYQLLWD